MTLHETRKNTHYALTSQFPVNIAIFRWNIGTDRIIAYHELFLFNDFSMNPNCYNNN